MNHADFVSLDIETILNRVVEWTARQTGSARVHWLSAHGFDKVGAARPEDSVWDFATAEIRGKHLLSYPAADPTTTWAIWHEVASLYPPERRFPMAPNALGNARLAYPLFFGFQFLGVILLEEARETNPVALINEIAKSLELASKYIYFGYTYLAAREESYLDELTGLYNQRYLPMALGHEINRSQRERTPFTLLFLDVDYFKMVNDGRGHLVGSKLLIELGKVLAAQVRACDYCFRYGGDEFIVLLSNAGPEGSLKVAERIRRAVEQTTYHVEGHNLNLTVSIGLASYPQHASDAAGLIHIADQAMYDGKRKSRNIVFVAS